MRDADFADELLDPMDEHVAALNAQGEIVAANEAWKRFARATRFSHQGQFYVTVMYEEHYAAQNGRRYAARD